ncbi:MAG: hypothetical protein Q9187_003730 [Circinaria calcarea]
MSGVYIRPVPSGTPTTRKKVNERNTTTAWCKFVRANNMTTKGSGRTTPTQEAHLAFSQWKRTRKQARIVAAKVEAEDAIRQKMLKRSPPQKDRKVNERNTQTAWCKYIRATAVSTNGSWVRDKEGYLALPKEQTAKVEKRSGRTTPTPESYQAFVEWKSWRQKAKKWRTFGSTRLWGDSSLQKNNGRQKPFQEPKTRPFLLLCILNLRKSTHFSNSQSAQAARLSHLP